MLARLLLTIVVLGSSLTCPGADGAESLSKAQAGKALHQAIEFFRNQVSASGGYLWQYSADLSRREGEGRASVTTAWVQPPGTPTVGDAFLAAYELTRDDACLDAARETAYALVNGQLRSGGWDYRIEFDPKQRTRYAYRVDAGNEKGRNTTTLDDNTTQAATRYLMRVDRTLDFKDQKIHEAVTFALGCLLKAQYPNGAWPQRFAQFPDPAKYPVKKAGYPESWSRTHPKKDYRDYYTFNDNTIADTIATMFEAAEIYKDAQYRAAAEKAGGFIILAQMPAPQPAWAQQYDADMHPAWARRFEPPAVTGGESHGVLRTLMMIYRQTADKKYLEPIPRALAYMKKSERPDGRLARFYELNTNRPLYFTKDYQLTYDDGDMPTHYSFIGGSWVKSIQTEYDRLLKTSADKLKPTSKKRAPRMSASLAARAKAVVGSMDERGAWVENGRLRYHGDDDPTTQIISCRTFVANLKILAQFLAAE